MRDYELVIIFSSQLEEDKQKKSIDKIKKSITGFKGKIKKTDNWGKKDFSYPIKKQTQGTYTQFKFSLDEGKIIDLEKKVKANENILRYLLIREE